MISSIFILALFLMKISVTMAVTIYNPYFHFPGASEPFMGAIVTVAVPIEAGTPGEVLLSTILEANYVVPWNQTQFEYPPIFPEENERTFLYDMFKRKIEDFGYAGKNCLLRAVCESSKMSSINAGVLGDILHILLTPSSTIEEKHLEEYHNAERLGRKNGCKKYNKGCSYSILNAISRYSDIMDLKTTTKVSNKIVKLF